MPETPEGLLHGLIDCAKELYNNGIVVELSFATGEWIIKLTKNGKAIDLSELGPSLN